MGRVLAGLVALGAAVALSSCSEAPAPTTSGPTALETATVETVEPVVQRVPAPRAKFDRTIYATTELAKSDLFLDLCRGPISVDLGDARPVLVVEHDYCGGLEWIPKLAVGQAVKLKGDGLRRGTYVVTEIKHADRGVAKIKDLPRTDVVLQTCISPKEMVLVGIERFVQPDPV